MITPRRLLRRLRALWSTRALDRDTQDELRHHLELETRALIAAGHSPAEAERAARLALGQPLAIRDDALEARGTAPFLDLAADFRYAVRVLWRSPVFTAVAVATIALGIGANTAVFSVVNAILLRQLPYREPEALVSLWSTGHSRAEYLSVRRRNQSFSGVAVYRQADFPVSLDAGGDPVRVTSAIVSPNFFDVLGLVPVRGRFFRDGEELPGASPVVVLSEALWRDRFGADSAVIGRTVDFDGTDRTVVGIAPVGFGFPNAAHAWIPVFINEQNPGPLWGGYGWAIIARLGPGVTKARARADVVRIAAHTRLENPIWRPGPEYLSDIQITDLRERLVGGYRRLLGVLLGAVVIVLLIACANVANLLLVRGTARERELAVRATLGAGRSRLIRQLVAESLVLALAGGICGVVMAVFGTPLLARLLPADMPRLLEVSVDAPALLYTALLAVGAGIVFGIVPAMRLSSTHLAASMAGGRATDAAGQRRLAGVLVSAQIALAVVLAVGAGLLLRSLGALLQVHPGFETRQVVAAQLVLPRLAYDTPEKVRVLTQALARELDAAAGLESAALTNQLPFDRMNKVMAMWVEGWTTDPNRLETFEVRVVTPEFFRTLGIEQRRGRLFGAQDAQGTAPVAIVNETAARRFWQGRDVIGGRVRYPWPGWLDVVGVVSDVRNNSLADDVQPTVYVPFAQSPDNEITVVARSRGEASDALSAIRRAVAAAAPDVPVGDQHTMRQLIERSVAAPRAASVLLSVFGVLALVLGAIGTYGMVAYGVERRMREIAVRLAVGARGADVLRLIVGGGLRLALAGIAAGLAASFALTRLMKGLLYGVEPTDPIAFAIAPAVLALSAIVASVIPAWRAMRVDPVSILRRD